MVRGLSWHNLFGVFVGHTLSYCARRSIKGDLHLKRSAMPGRAFLGVVTAVTLIGSRIETDAQIRLPEAPVIAPPIAVPTVPIPPPPPPPTVSTTPVPHIPTCTMRCSPNYACQPGQVCPQNCVQVCN